MKNIIHKIQDRIATKFLIREFKKEHAGKVLAIALDKVIKECIDEKSDGAELTYDLEYKNNKFEIKNDILIKQIK